LLHRNGRLGRLWAPPVLCFLSFVLAASPAHADDPRYGDSTWVAPYPVADSTGNPKAPGPRTAEKESIPVGETILRTPFRLIGLPFRAIGAGLQWVAGVAAPHVFVPHTRVGVRTPVAIFSPTLDYTTTTGLEPGFSIHRPSYREDIPDISIHGSWSFKDQRQTSFRLRVGSDTLAWFGGLFARYRYRPTTRFYGTGNETHKQGRAYYLSELGEINLFAGRHLTPHLLYQFVAGLTSYASRQGYGAAPLVEQTYNPSEITGYGHASRMIGFGVNGEWSKLNRGPNPSAGVYLRGEIQRFRSLNDIGVDYVQWDAEWRGYVPVFADRRVIAMRLAYEVANPDAGSNPLPFDRLPVAVNDYRFLAFHGSQFRDQQIGVAQIEYRWLVLQDVQMFALAQIGEVSPSQHLMRWAEKHESYGGGLRYYGPDGGWIRMQVETGAQGANFDLLIGRGF
jgi:hypothetical protein